ncbi:hypothetical protein FLAN108750_02695 [Flavobacterium antarcticum]|uniref:hypothetical protein n=1 Tax=Flavobacterium antarcticum TaxID=271155 RepID=UPI0003B4CB9C|nr:hypothetical protein [Flavobacterium antarcticum]
MFPKAIPYLLSLFVLSFCTNADSNVDFTTLFQLPNNMKESSAVEVTEKSDLIWTIQDRGNKPEIFGLDSEGKIAQQGIIQDIENVDWEDLTSDKEGNLYIGDFGNNKNDRKDLAIYKIDAAHLLQKEINISGKISFYLPEQKAFPPKKSNRIFDVEAFFIFKDNFYLFTKNRSSKFDGTTSLYKVPNAPGTHAAELISSFKTCENFNHCAITSADISSSGKTIALLSSDQVWLFSNFKEDDFFNGKMKNRQLPTFTQKEGICFKDENTLYITDEKDKKTGGNLYKLNLLKTKK